jgi:preprotein translocase subunit YajC
MEAITVPFLTAIAQPAPGQSPNMWVQMLPFVLMLGIFYLLVLRPMRSRQKKVADFQSSLKVGDRVITTSGIYGQITKIGDQSVKLQIADRITIEIARAAVGGLQGQEPVVQEQNSSL